VRERERERERERGEGLDGESALEVAYVLGPPSPRFLVEAEAARERL
jgi:hypothetical protein